MSKTIRLEDQESFDAWAIDTRSDEGHGLIGRYWYFGDKPPVIPVHMEGCQTALFKTRQLARDNLPSVNRAFPKAAVGKVKVIIERR